MVFALSRDDDIRLTDGLAQLDELHLCGHVAHGPHALSYVLVVQVAVTVVVKLLEGKVQLCAKG